MSIYLGNTEIGKELVDSYELGNVYLGANLIQQGMPILPVVTNGLTGFFDFSNSLTYNNTGSTTYTLTTPYERNGNQTGSLDYLGTQTPSTASFITTDNTASVNSLFWCNVNNNNNFRSEFELTGSQSAWTIVMAVKYLDVLIGGTYPGAALFSNINAISQANAFIFRDSSQLNASYITLGNTPVVTGLYLDLNQWYIIQVSVGGPSQVDGVYYNINNTITGSVGGVSGAGCEDQFSFNRQIGNLGSDQRGGKGFCGVSAIYSRGLSADEMTYNFNSLRNRYGL